MKNGVNKSIITAILAAGLLSACGKSPENVADSFYRAMGKGEVTEAKTYLSSEMINTMGDAKLTRAITAEASRISACGGIKNIETDLKGEGEVRTGTSIVSYVSETCKTSNHKTKMVKEDGDWKLSISK